MFVKHNKNQLRNYMTTGPALSERFYFCFATFCYPLYFVVVVVVVFFFGGGGGS